MEKELTSFAVEKLQIKNWKILCRQIFDVLQYIKLLIILIRTEYDNVQFLKLLNMQGL